MLALEPTLESLLTIVDSLGVSGAPFATDCMSPAVPWLATVHERLAPPVSEAMAMLADVGSGVSPGGKWKTLLLPVLQALEGQPSWMMSARSAFSLIARVACMFRSACFAAAAISAQVSPNRKQRCSDEVCDPGGVGPPEPRRCSVSMSTMSHTCRNSSRSAVTCANSFSAAWRRARNIGVGCSSIGVAREPTRECENERPVARGDASLVGLSD